MNNDNNEKINFKKLNTIIDTSDKLLRFFVFLIVVASVYIGLILLEKIQIFDIIFRILTVISPLFVGMIIAWLFKPFVRWLKKKGINRTLGTALTYVMLIGVILFIVGSIVPLLVEQTNEFIGFIPNLLEDSNNWINNAFSRIDGNGVDVESIKQSLLSTISNIGSGLSESLPETIFNIGKGFLSGAGIFFIGLIIGFYLLKSDHSVSTFILERIPSRISKDTTELFHRINDSLKSWVQGALIDMLVLFAVTTIAFWIAGLKAPILFGLFCAITNVIPYVGPYIGGAPAVLVGLSQNPVIGLAVLIIIVVTQVLEANILQPFIMSKTTKLHPVVIILGLLVFGHFFGVLGMVFATPILTALKTIYIFFAERYNWFNING